METLTAPTQRDALARVYRRFAESVIECYGLGGAHLTLLEQKTNVTFRVDAADGPGRAPDRYLLRLCRPGVYDERELRSEALWLQTLTHAGLRVPEPVAARNGSFVTRMDFSDLPEPRPVMLFRWVPGELIEGVPSRDVLEQVGELAARIHNHGERFEPPAEFRRPRWDADRLFGTGPLIPPGEGGRWVPPRARRMLEEATQKVRREMAEIGEGPDVFGLIHKDLEPDNTVLDEDGRVHAIDFADCGWGYFLYDVAASLLPLREHAKGAELQEAFLRGYRRHRSLGANFEQWMPTFLTARILFSIRFMIRHSMDRADVRAWADSVIPRMIGEVRRYLKHGSGSGAGEEPALRHLSTLDFLSHLKDRRVRLWADGDQLRFQAPKGALTTELKAELKTRKSEVLEFLCQGSAAGGTAEPLRPIDAEGPIPLSFSQQRLWFIDRLEPGGVGYNVARAVVLSGRLQMSTLAQALQEVVRRHGALRTTFASTAGEPEQIVVPRQPVRLTVRDLRRLGGGSEGTARRERARRLASVEALRSFDLRQGPLLRVVLLRLSDTEHVAVSVMHHIVSDGWSAGVLFRELGTLYTAFVQGRPSPLPELPIQYTDFARWQRRQLAGDVLEAQLAYWRRQLEGAPGELELPTDRPRPPVASGRGGKLDVRVPAAVTGSLRKLTHTEGATLFMVLFAAFNTLLFRHSGQDDIVLGFPIANRNRTEIEGLIGFFVNTLVLRTRLDGDPSFRELVARVRRTTLEAYEHQELPFEKLVEELQPERHLNAAPLFQVLFSLQNAPGEALDLPGVELSPLSLDLGLSKLDLSLILLESDGGLRGGLEYSTDLFDGTTAERILQHFQRLLAGIAETPDRPLSQLPLLPPGEAHQVLYGWNDVPEPTGVQRPVAREIARRARECPDAVAVVFEQQALTYGELVRRAGRLARRLHQIGVGPETAVGVFFERSLEMVVGVLGVLHAGGAYVPLDPSYPEERLSYMLTEPGARVMVTRRRWARRLASTDVTPVLLDEVSSESQTAEDPPRDVPPGARAYVIYTSGTLGRPKGVVGTHGALADFVRSYLEVSGHRPGDRHLLILSFAFDASLGGLFPTLCRGATLVVPPNPSQLSGRELLETFEAEQITCADIPVALWNGWVEGLVRAGDENLLPALRYLVAGGEPVYRERLAAWGKLIREPVDFVGAYGPTETTVAVTVETTAAGEVIPVGRTRLPIGRPIGGVQVRLLGETGRPVPVGSMGEIFLGGSHLTRGYLNDPAQTASRFVPDPFTVGGRLYRTGDFALHLADGRLQFLVRRDEQVKVRGYRVEPAEVEAVLARHPAVALAAVAAHEGDARGAWLAGYVVPRAGQTPTVGELRTHLQETLPPYMVPSAFVLLEDLPRNPASGKVDLQALPVPDRGTGGASGGAPKTPTEELLAALWSQVLGVDTVGVDDQFFDLGGHSLLATQLVSRIEETFGVEIPLRRLFEAPTVAELARVVDDTLKERDRSPPPPLQPLPARVRRGGLPLSFAQQRLWLLDRFEEVGPAYNVPAAIRLEGTLSETALEHGLDELVRRHESLRTRFPEASGEPLQVVMETLQAAMTPVDLTALSPADQEHQVRRLAAAEARRRFDLRRGPLLRRALLHLADGQHVLLVTLHHIVSDGWSMGIFFRELDALYEAFRQGRVSPLAELPVQYGDFAHWQRQWLEGEVLDEELAFWRRRLEGVPATLDLPTDRPRPRVRSFRGGSLPLRLGQDLSEAVLQHARRAGATPFMLLLAAFTVVLRCWTGQRDVVVGSPVAGRHRRDVENLIGFFVNTLVLRVDLGNDPPWRTLLEQVRGRALDAYQHQHLPFERLVEELIPQRNLSHAPLVQVLFVFQNAPMGGLELSELTLEPLTTDAGTAKFDLTLNLGSESRDAEIVGSLEYARDLFDATTVARLAQHFRRVLAAAIEDPGREVTALPWMAPAEVQQVVVEWNDTCSSYPRSTTLPARFRATARSWPDKVALVAGDVHLSYGGLERRVSAMAGRLRSLGVRPESRVGLFASRSPAWIVAALGILEAGGAYVPLDPSYPAERLALLLADAGPSVVLADPDRIADLPSYAGRTESLGMPLEMETSDPVSAAHSPTQSESLAYVMYTSGSTGRPKGVAVTHRNVARLVLEADFARLDSEEVFLQLAPTAFDASTLEIWAPLLHGGRLVLPPPGPLDLDALGDVLRERQVTTLWLTAGLFHQMVETNLGGLTNVRQLLAGGDVLSPKHVLRVLAEQPDVTVINGYGPTENTTFTSCHRISWEELPGAVPIGRPIADTRVYVMDDLLRPMPVGIVGELYAGGDGVARGYLDWPSRTAASFVPDPFADRPGARMYRTGDLARRLRDGTLDFLGRMDGQVKVRGFRIEPGEIEAALHQRPEVAEAAVVTVPDNGADKHLKACVVPTCGAPEDAPRLRSQLQTALRNALPVYMVPSAWVFLDALPLNANGKVDRRVLAGLRPEGPAEAKGEEPRTPVEELVAGLWSELLEYEKIPREADFFDLGGHSLRATQLVSRLRETFGVDLQLRQVFETPTVTGLARSIEDARRVRNLPEAPPLSPSLREPGPQPPSFAQQRLWLLDRFESVGSAYNVPLVVRLQGLLDSRRLERAVSEVAERHEVLRTTFRTGDDGTPVQVIAPEASVVLRRADLTRVSRKMRELVLRRLVAAEMGRSFDLETGPLLRASLLELAPEEHVLAVTMHHIVSDGWSVGLFLREVTEIHAALSEGRPADLEPLAIQYADFAVWQRGWLKGDVLEAKLEGSRRRLEGAPQILELPTDRPRPAVQTFRGASRNVRLPAALSREVGALSQRHGATPFMTLLAAFGVLLGRAAHREDVLVGTPVAGRNRRETEDLIGFFVNTLVLRVDASGGSTFTELLTRVRRDALEAYEHQDLPFERLVEELVPQRAVRHNPLFQVAFALQNVPRGELEMPGLTWAPVPLDGETAKFDLTLALEETSDGFRGALEYNRDLFDDTTMGRWLRHLETLLAAAVQAPDVPVHRLPRMSSAEYHQVVVETAASAPLSLGEPIHHQVESWARRAPEAVAVQGCGVALTYGELETRANRWARHLRGLGVGPEAVVAVFLDRSPEEVTLLLAVLKAGGAYLPMDPSYPAERLRLLVTDADADLVVTSRAWPGARPETAARQIVIEDEQEGLRRHRDTPPACGATPAHLAYVIYTSGSTGRPKGVLVEHRSLSHLVGWHVKAFGVGPQTRAPRGAGLAFDASVWELWPYLAAGASVHLPQEEVRRDPVRIRRWWAREQLTVGFLSTPMAEAFLAEPEPPLPALEQLLTGGDRLHRPPSQCSFAVVNNYGPTENTVVATSGVVSSPRGLAESARSGPPHIGRAIPGVGVRCVDPHGQSVPLGISGELILAGAGLARGYLGRPRRTAASFQPDPFATAPGSRIYRTGDLARRCPDGRIDFLGRVDHQVQLRGLRIEPGEIEATLADHDGISEAAVTVHESEIGEERLVAYVVPRGDDVPPAELATFLRHRLPETMVPPIFMSLDALPLTPNGKLDRRALPAPEAGRGEKDPRQGPRNELELHLAAVWEEILGIERVGIHDDFFALGGHSLLAVRLVGRLETTLGVRLPLDALFRAPTLEALAAELRRDGRNDGSSTLVPIRPPVGEEEEEDRPTPLLCVHPVGGHVLCYDELARRVGWRGGFWGLQSPSPEGGGPRPSTLEEMAAAYLDEARKIHSGGPWRLGGWSMGGLVCFEMARQLSEAGESVAAVILLDTLPPGQGPDAPRDDELVAAFAGDLIAVVGDDPEMRREALAQVDPAAGLEDLFDTAHRAGLLPEDLSFERVRGLFDVFAHNARAMARYRGGPYAGRLHLLRAGDRDAGDRDQEIAGWQALATGGVEVTDLPGDHYSILDEDTVEAWAQRLEEILVETLAPRNPSS